MKNEDMLVGAYLLPWPERRDKKYVVARHEMREHADPPLLNERLEPILSEFVLIRTVERTSIARFQRKWPTI